MLQIKAVEKSFGWKKVLEIPSLELESGIHWMHGPNGSGKTTLLRILAGILPFRGDILLLGHSLRQEPVTYRRLIGWADAEPLYPGFLTGLELLAFYRDILRPPAGQAEDLIDRLGIAPWLGSRAATWSAGMCKKISLLLGFIGRPALILLDEPLVTLDEPGATALLELVEEWHAENGTSFILSSHQALAGAGRAEASRIMVADGAISLT